MSNNIRYINATPSSICIASLHDKYSRLLEEHAFRYLNEKEGSEDLVQDIFLHLWSNRSRIRIASSLKGYLLGMLRYSALNELRRQEVRRRFAEEYIMEQEYALPSYEEPEHEKSSALAKTLIAKLPDRCREAFLLSRIEGLTFREIAEEMGISVRTVEKHVGKGVRRVGSWQWQ